MSISKTFCPAKWDEILVNLSANYVYSCCKATPIKIVKKEDINQALDQQKKNLLSSIEDPACNYCWQVENVGHKSRRHTYLENFDYSTINQYSIDLVRPKMIEINLGNECNFQCIYCNPKFSSQWESDVKRQPYNIFADKFFYSVDEKNPNNIDDTIGWLKEIAEVDRLDIMGGEPLYNKNFIPVISSIKSKQLAFSTNLSFKDTSVIDTILNLSSQYEEIFIRVSIDSTDKNAEFSRFGLDYQKFLSNLHYLINHAQSNVKISIGSLMTSITIRDLNNTITLVKELHELNPTSVLWDLAYCQDPKIFTLNTLPDKFKLDILNQLNTVKELSWVKGVDTLIGAVNGSKFNGTLYGLMKHFVKEFSERKGIVVPFELE